MLILTTANFQTEVIEGSRTQAVLVDFWAAWCGPCRTLGPVLESLASEYNGQVRFCKLDTDAEPDLAGRYQIRSIPAVKLFKNGAVISEFVGAQSAGWIRNWLAPQLPGAPPKESDLCIAQANQLLESQQAAAATQILDKLPADVQASDVVRRLYAQAHFVALVGLDPSQSADSAVRAAAAAATLDGEYAQAIELLLTHMQANSGFARSVGRGDLLRIFELAGHQHPSIANARRRLANLLN
jgi:putative thioredoxin